MARPDPDRRRFILATIVTLLALPALWWANQDDDSGAPTVASVGVDVGASSDSDPAASAGSADAALEEPAPVFLDGPSRLNAGVAEIAVPAPPLRAPITGSASYSSIVISVDKCFAKGVPTGTKLTIVNLDNNRSTTCTASLAPSTQREDLVLHTRAYTRLADLTDAPIPVEIRQ